MKKIYSLLLLAGLCLFGAQSVKAAKVYFQNTDNWTEIHCFAYTSSTNDGDWPGADITSQTEVIDGYTYYYYETNQSTVIFNNGNGSGVNQTANLSVADGKFYYQPTINQDGSNGDWLSFNYYLKNKWETANWYWKALSYNGDGTFSVVAKFGGEGCNYNDEEYDSGSEWRTTSQMGNPVTGETYKFTLSPISGTLAVSEPELPTVSLSVNASVVDPGDAIELTPLAVHFSGTPTYTYSYSTNDGADWTDMEGNTLDHAAAAGTHYIFKVVANYAAASEQDEDQVEVDVKVTFPANTKVWFDARACGRYAAIYLPGTPNPAADDNGGWSATLTASQVISFTLSDAWTVTTWNHLYGMSVGANWTWTNIASKEPTNNTYNKMVLDADGSDYTWEVAVPEVTLAADAAKYAPGATITLTANTLFFNEDPTIAYYYSTNGEDWNALESNTFVVPGTAWGLTYTFKAVATLDAVSKEATTTASIVSSLTVAGSQNLCGTNNGPTNTANDMALVDGVLTWSASRILLPTSANSDGNKNVVFKIVEDHSTEWSPCYPDNDYVVVVENAGYYDVKITFDWNTKTITPTLTSLGQKVEIMQGFNSWTPVEMATTDNGATYTAAINFEAGEYTGESGFRVRFNDSGIWNGFFGVINRENKARELNSTEHNVGIVADIAGEYVFTYTTETNTMSVAYPEVITRPARAGYQTLCVPFDATISNAVVYTFGNVADGKVVFNKFEGNLVHGNNYLIKAVDPEQSIVITKTDGATETITPNNPTGRANGLYGQLGATYTYVYADDSNWQVYILSNGQFHQITGEASATIKSTKAYLHIEPEQQGGAPSVLRIVEAENNTTDIQSLEASETAVKFFENGQLFILRDGVVYDATGRAVR